MTTAGEHYRVIRDQLTELAAGLSAEQAAAPVPALPGWSAQDTYAHLTGITADVLAGHATQPDSVEWTAKHVADRRGRSLAEIVEEWGANAPKVEAFLDTPEGRPAVIAVVDLFHHSHDIRGALGRRDARDTPEVVYVAHLLATFKRRGWEQAGHPPIEVATGSGRWRFGEQDGAPTAALTTSDFELTRILIGRRSRAQMLAAGWIGDPEPIVDLLPRFGPPVTDLTE